MIESAKRARKYDTLKVVGARVQMIGRPSKKGTVTRTYNSWRVRVHWDRDVARLDYPISLRSLEAAEETV